MKMELVIKSKGMVLRDRSLELDDDSMIVVSFLITFTL